MKKENNDKTIIKNSNVYGKINIEDLPNGYKIDDRYTIKEKIGHGGFGAVYRAFDEEMNIDKALKIIPANMVNNEEAMDNLRKEAQTMINLSHENIVRVYDFHNSGLIKFIDMEFVDGKTLADINYEYKKKDKKVPENRVIDYALKIAKAVLYAHDENVIHKDIKPQNIMLTKDGKIKIMDFGIAEIVNTSKSRIDNSSSAGTPKYMPPEQLIGKNIGKETDIYSFGITIYELLAGRTPFYQGKIEYQIINIKPDELDLVADGLNELLMKCLEKDYKNRYRNMTELTEELEEIKKELKNKEKKYFNSLSDKWKEIFAYNLKNTKYQENLFEKKLSAFDIQNVWALEKIDCSHNQITSLEPLCELKNLQKLYCYDNKLTSLEPLRELKNLEELACCSNQLTSLEPLCKLKNLEKLDCHHNQLTNLEPLCELENLEELYCYYNQLTSLEPLRELKNLYWIDCRENQITSLEPIGNLKHLQKIDCSENNITDLKPLREIKNLKILNCSNNFIFDLNPIRNLKKLQELYCGDNEITDIEPILNLKNLQKLYCNDNNITNL
ncbi:MAG: protein kinase, partial [Candidatus Marinimicrobia bacterium]|nr:protein kinase [Candidatus Neomarinimicrobiota bacterium]